MPSYSRTSMTVFLLMIEIAQEVAQLTTVDAPASAKPVTTRERATFKEAEAEIDSDASRLVEVYKDIHQHPELSFMETRPAGIVAQQLKELGFEVQTGIGKTGIVGIREMAKLRGLQIRDPRPRQAIFIIHAPALNVLIPRSQVWRHCNTRP